MYMRMGIFSLNSSHTSIEVGEYGLAFKFFEFAIALPTFIMNSVYPELLQLQLKKGRFFSARIKQLCSYLFIFSLITTAGVWVFAGTLPFIRIDFLASVAILRMLAILIPVFFMTSPLIWLFVMRRQQKFLVMIYFVASVGSLLLNNFLVYLCVIK